MRRTTALLPLLYSIASCEPSATAGGVTYKGLYKDKVESFLGIRYGQDTGGDCRFKPPQAYEPVVGTTVKATDPGPACPQATGGPGLPLAFGNITHISEDCLRLNVARPNSTEACDRLPVMVYIHGIPRETQSSNAVHTDRLMQVEGSQAAQRTSRRRNQEK